MAGVAGLKAADSCRHHVDARALNIVCRQDTRRLGLFCRLDVATPIRVPLQPGVYARVTDGEVRYVGDRPVRVRDPQADEQLRVLESHQDLGNAVCAVTVGGAARPVGDPVAGGRLDGCHGDRQRLIAGWAGSREGSERHRR